MNKSACHKTHSRSFSFLTIPGWHGNAMIAFGGGWIGANPGRTPFNFKQSFTTGVS